MIRLVFVFLIFFCNLFAKSILCIDVGGTRIKACVLSDPITIEKLQKNHIVIMPSQGWKTDKLPLLLSNEGIFSVINQSYDEISFSLSGPIKDNSIFLKHEKTNIPKYLKKAFEDQVKCNVYIENDAVCHLKGALLWQNIVNQHTSFPCIYIALGTGVGCAIAKNENNIVDIEISKLSDVNYKRLQNCKLDLTKVPNAYLPQYILGHFYFELMKNSSFFDIQKDFTINAQNFLLDFLEYFQELNIKTIFIGGGNSNILLPDINIKNKKIILLNDIFFRRHKINSEYIPLIGSFIVATELGR